MLGKTSSWDSYLPSIQKWMEEGKSNKEMLALLGAMGKNVTERTLRRAKAKVRDPLGSSPVVKVGAAKASDEPSVSVHGDQATVWSDPVSDSRTITPEEIIKQRKLNPDDWDVRDMILNQWDSNTGKGNTTTLYQIKLFLRRKTPIEFVFPGRIPSDYKAPKINKGRDKDKPFLGVVCGDSQVPYNDERMEDCFLQFLADVKPDKLTDVGDQGDNPSVSNHKKNPKWHIDLNTCVQATTDLNYNRRRACETMEYEVLIGNHDVRLDNFVMDRAEALYGIKRGDLPTDEEYQGSVLEWAYLTRADDLNINVVSTDGDQYFHSEIVLVEDDFGLTAEHGHKTGKSAMLNTIDRRDNSVVFGHTHTMGMQTKTVWDKHGNHRTIYVANIGTQCKLKGGLGYAKNPDWVNGFLTYVKWPGGGFTLEFAKYEDGVLYWRDKRYFSNI